MKENWDEMIKRAVRDIARNRKIDESEVTREMILDSTESFGELHTIACKNGVDESEWEDLVGYVMWRYEV